MKRTSRRKRAPGAGAKAEEEEEEMAAAPRRSGKKTISKPLCQIFQELEEQAIKESLRAEERSAGERSAGERSAGSEASSASTEWDTKAAKRSCRLGPRGLRGGEAAPGPSALPEPEESGPLENFVVFHCLDCFAVLGDSVHLCGEETRLLGILVFSRITHNVIVDNSLLVGIKGALLGSTYNPLFCHSCGLSVGFRLYSTYATLSDFKGLFCLFKNSIMCYVLKTKSMANATELEFPTKHLNAQISKLKEKMMIMDSNLTAITEDLKRIIHVPLDVELD